jgi:SAM-dependent methyltransferase
MKVYHTTQRGEKRRQATASVNEAVVVCYGFRQRNHSRTEGPCGMTHSRRLVLFLASFLMLYFELALIRWVPGHVRVLAYFTNFVLIACFFGMGLGMVLSKSGRDLGRWAPAAITLLVLLALGCKQLWIESEANVFLFLEYEGVSATRVALYPMLVVSYLAIAAAFVPFGQLVGRSFGEPSSLGDYSVNLLGSMAGILVFFLYSWLALPAWTWFLLGMVLLTLLAPPRLWSRSSALALSALVVALVWYADRGTIWSPYQKLDVTPLGIDRTTGAVMPFLHSGGNVEYLPPEIGFNLRINDDFYQYPINLTDAIVAKYPALRKQQSHYGLPFRLKPNARRVLIVGGGTGNDAAAALRGGAQQVDVVDIDPEIVALGKERHPEHPYSDPRVRVFVDDARHFFHHAEPGYDVIVFALLDSHRLLSTLSSLRLDSYVFTVEAFREAQRLLGPDGVQVTAFAIDQPWMRSRFYEMLRQVYGQEPILAGEHGITTEGLVLLSGPGSRSLGLPVQPRPVDTQAVLPTDDWPFVYALDRALPPEYQLALALVLLLTVVVWRLCTRQRGWPSGHFFCLGAGFLLLETKNVTTIALVFGSTWYVNSVVFFSVLVMALLANLVTAGLGKLPLGLAYGGLFAAIGLNYLLPLQDFAGASLGVRLLVVGGVTALPLFFAGLIFARSFVQAESPADALGANVLGGVVGGMVEYMSLVMGLRFLFVLIAAFYGLSLLTLWPLGKRARAPELPEAATIGSN